ncbi:hypothetical protein GGU11DRAFT_691909, partial [Lentinula aff. detonsa]
FATISLPPHPTRHSTPVSKRTLNPLFPAAQSTFDFPIYLSLADRLGVLEIVIWDKDYFGVEKIGMGRKEYLGEVGISLEDWFSMREPGEQVRALGWHEQGNTPFSISLASTRSNTHARGTVQLKIGFVEDERDPDVGVDFEEVYSELLKRSRPSLVNIPPVSGFSLSSCPSSSFVPLRLARNIPSRTKKVNVCKSVKMSICVVLRA